MYLTGRSSARDIRLLSNYLGRAVLENCPVLPMSRFPLRLEHLGVRIEEWLCSVHRFRNYKKIRTCVIIYESSFEELIPLLECACLASAFHRLAGLWWFES